MIYILIFLLIILLVGMLAFYGWPYLLSWVLMRHIDKMQQAAQDDLRQRAAYQRQQQRPQSGRTKIYSREEGEYVEFEDLPKDAGSQQTYTEVRYTSESQVSDAEWEDID